MNSALTKVPSVQEMEQMSPGQLVKNEATKDRFVSLFNKIHGTSMGESVYEAEQFHFMKQLQEKPDLAQCTRLSLYGAFMDVSVQGLSFDPSKKLAYLVPYNINVGTREQPKWEKRCSLQISPYGELALRQSCGQISHADDPVIVYEGDTFMKYIDESGQKKIDYRSSIPRKSNKIIGSFIRIVKGDGSVDFFEIDQTGIERLRQYSERKNSGKANALYTSCNGGIDPGFLAAKTIKHAFKSYPKVKLRGQFSKMEDVDHEEVIDYGIEVPDRQENFQRTEPIREHRGGMAPNPSVSDAARVAAETMMAEDQDTHNISDDSNLFD